LLSTSRATAGTDTNTKHVYITSFFKSHLVPKEVEKFSAAVYPPKGYEWMPKAMWTDIRDKQGNWTRPRNFEKAENPLMAYRNALWELYSEREREAVRWLSEREGAIALCCWCPADRPAQRQLKEWGSFVCHTAVLGEFITALGHRVWYDSDRLRMAVLTQHVPQKETSPAT
jgi:hypothetical protein